MMLASKAWDTMSQLISLVVILVFTFCVFDALTRIETNQAQSAKQSEVDKQFSNLERRILERMEKPERWTDSKNLPSH